MQRIAIPIAAVAVLVAASCAGREQFIPTDNPNALSPTGYSAAEYTLNTPGGPIGQAKVWSNGAYKAEIQGEKRTVLNVGFEIENQTNAPMAFELGMLRLDAVQLDKVVLQDVQPTRITGANVVPPQDERFIDAYFVFPRGVSPGDLDSFRVRWRVRSGGNVYTQRTPFLEFDPYDYYPYSYWWGYGWYGPWGPYGYYPFWG